MKALFSAYRLDQYSNPEGFYANIGLVLEQYSIETIRFVTDPRTGIQRRCNWPPSVKEVVDACSEHVQAMATKDRFNNWGKSQARIEGPKEPRPTMAEMKERYGDNWGIDQVDKPVGFKTGQAQSFDAVIKYMKADPSVTRNQKQPFVINIPAVAAHPISGVLSEDESVAIMPAAPTKLAA